jgi:hypothetical protein
MNSQLLSEILKAKEDRRKQLRQLPIDEKVIIIERLRDMAMALGPVKEKLARKPGVPPIR